MRRSPYLCHLPYLCHERPLRSVAWPRPQFRISDMIQFILLWVQWTACKPVTGIEKQYKTEPEDSSSCSQSLSNTVAEFNDVCALPVCGLDLHRTIMSIDQLDRTRRLLSRSNCLTYWWTAFSKRLTVVHLRARHRRSYWTTNWRLECQRILRQCIEGTLQTECEDSNVVVDTDYPANHWPFDEEGEFVRSPHGYALDKSVLKEQL